MMLEAFKTKVLPLKNKLFRYANSILNDYDLSKDVVQETMIKSWEKRDDFYKINNLEAWCMRVTRNFALDKIRSKKPHEILLEVNLDSRLEDLSPYQLAEMESTFGVIERIISRLPMKQQETFQLRDMEGYSYQEISDITGYNINDVKVSIYRARKVIKTSLLKLQANELEKTRSAS